MDRKLLLSVVALMVIGLLMVTSASMMVAERQYGQPFYFLIRQVVFLVLGLIAGILVWRTPIDFWQRHSVKTLFIAIGLLIIVLIPGIGSTVNGSTRWIRFAGIGFQVSEIVKLCIILYLSGYIVRHQHRIQREFSAFLRPLFLLGIIAGLLLREPDFGAAFVILATAMGMLFLAGVRLRQFCFVILIAGSLAAILAISSPYRLERLTNFLNPWAHPFAGGYQLTQALIAFGRGGWAGVGLGGSIQKLFYLPEAHTDFLFAVLVEEFGLIGGLIVLGLFAIFVIRALVIGRNAVEARHYFAAYLCYGCGLWLGLQAMINIGVNTGLLPTKGLTLPFLSAGGSSTVVNCMVVALLLRVDRELHIPTGKLSVSVKEKS